MFKIKLKITSYISSRHVYISMTPNKVTTFGMWCDGVKIFNKEI